MLNISADQFKVLLQKYKIEITDFINNDLPVIIGKMAVDHFKENFQEEAWQRTKWKEVKRRQSTWERGGKTIPSPTKGAARTRKILTGSTGELAESIQYTPDTGKVKIHSDVVYAAIHNYGLEGKAFGKYSFTMPKRQFIGEDPELDEIIEQEIEKKLKQLFKL